jgi:hypothetical protein
MIFWKMKALGRSNNNPHFKMIVNILTNRGSNKLLP